jgi:hypothetical protein
MKDWCSRPRQRITSRLPRPKPCEEVGMSEVIISPQLLGKARCRSRGEYARSQSLKVSNKNIPVSKSYPQKKEKSSLDNCFFLTLGILNTEYS